MKQTKPEVLIPSAWLPESQSLVDLMAEQEKFMGQTEQREMLVFLRGVAFGKMFNKSAPSPDSVRDSA